ncbi:MAG: MFS transporter [Coleofasciculaceae cyanobacterium]
MKTLRTLKPQQRNNLLILFVAGLLFWASLACLLPTLPLYVEDLGGTKQQIGLVIAAFAVGLLLCRPSLGKLSDRRSRKLVVLIGFTVLTIAPLGYLFAKSIPLLLLIRVFHGISIAAYTTGNSTLIVDLSPVDKRGEVIGYMSLTTPIGMAIGPAIGGFLQAEEGYTALFLFSFVTGLLGLILAFRVQEPRLTPVGAPVVDTQQSKTQTARMSVEPDNEKFWTLLGSPRLKIPTLVMLLAGLIFGSLATFVALYIREAKVDLNVGWFYTAAAMTSFCSRFFTGRASDRYGRGLFITVSLVFYSLSMLLLAQAQSPVAFLLAGLLEGIGAGTLLPTMIALISDRSHAHERGRVFALCIGGFDVGIAIAGPVFGTFAQHWGGYQGIFSLTLGIALLALIIFMTQNGEDLRYSLRFATGREQDIYALSPVCLQGDRGMGKS